MEKVYVVGVSMTPFGKLFDKTVKELTKTVLEESLEDAGLERKDIEAAYFANTGQGLLEGQHAIRGQVALRSAGLQGIPMYNIENACASASTALNTAVNHIKAGEADIALAIGVEKMNTPVKDNNFKIFDAAWDVETVDENIKNLNNLGKGIEVPDGWESKGPYSLFMDVYASFARFHMNKFGTTIDQIAAVSAKNHQNSTLNPLAHYQKSYTKEDILNAPRIVYPLTLPMCAPVSDGAAAAIICSEKGLKKLNRSRAIEIKASVIQTSVKRDPDEVEKHITVLAAKKAYEKANLGPEDISVAEVHDATAPAEIIQVENLGFCKYGGGGPLSEEGYFNLNGKLPVNPSGGLESKGHPIGATGLAQIYELVKQLRGEAEQRQVNNNPKVAIAENGGGLYGIEEAVCAVTILGK